MLKFRSSHCYVVYRYFVEMEEGKLCLTNLRNALCYFFFLEEFLDHLKGVLRSVEDENSKTEEDLKELSSRCLEGWKSEI